MIEKPWFIKGMTATLLVFPVTFILWFFNSGAPESSSFSGSPILDCAVFAITCGIVALGIWVVRAWGFIIFALIIIGLLLAEMLQIVELDNYLVLVQLLDCILILIILYFLFHKQVRTPYFNPRIRWWERSNRHKAQLSADITVGDAHLQCELLDFSLTGCFADLEANLILGDRVWVKVTFKESQVEVAGRVIRISTEPKGIGIKFEKIDKRARKNIKGIMLALSDVDESKSGININ